MKKNWRPLALLLALLLGLTLSGCGGAASAGAAAYDTAPEAIAEEAEDAVYNGDYYEAEYFDITADTAAAPAEAPAPNPEAPSENGGITDGGSTSSLSDKIIYTAYAEVETTAFEDSVQQVYRLLEQYGGFVESSSVTGTDLNDSYYGYAPSRSANFTLRVPKDRYSAVTSALDTVGNVTLLTNNAQNITMQYTDTQSRLNAYQVEEERLLEILGQADTVEDMIEVESRLSDIRYEKEWLTSQLKNWDNQISYSTVTLYIQEVRELTQEPEPEPQGYWAQVGAGFLDTLKAMGRFFKGLFRVFVAALPVLVPLGGIAAVLIVVIRKKTRAAASLRAEARQKAAEARARAEAAYAAEHTHSRDSGTPPESSGK